MPDGQVLEFTRVTKRFNEVTAVSDLSARVEPGAVTAFLGPNGAGKTTTLRILLGQVRPTSGTATIGGTAFSELRQPLRTIGSVLEETAYRPRRTAYRQLTIAAKANGIPLSRVDQVLAEVGLEGEGDSRIGGFSLGMRQRLSVAHALLGDPGALVFDEPANGLDPEGIRWMRLLMRRLADEGRTVLVSSHVLSEVEQVADNVLVLSKGELVLSSGIETLADPAAGTVVVDAADRAGLTTALSAAGFDVEVLRSGLTVRGGDAGTVGAVAAAAGIALSTLLQRGPTLEDVFIDLVRGGKLEARASAAASQLAIPARIAGLPIAAAPVAAPVAADSDAADAESDATDSGITRIDADTDGTDAVVAEEDAMFAEIAAVSAAISESTPTDPVTAAAVASDDHDTFTPRYEDGAGDDDGDEDAAAAAAVAEAEAANEAVIDVLPHADSSDTAETPAPSFDEILFGTAAPTPVASVPTALDADHADDAPTHDVEQVFADRSDDDVSDEDAADESTDDVTDGSTDESENSDDESENSKETGLEIFQDLDSSNDEQSDTDEQSDADDSDPRSAAVSSMLAAAAKAYYEDEPKDYPLGDDPQQQDEPVTWSVASTGVIDTVPTPESEGEPEHHEHSEGEHHEPEHHEHSDGEHEEHREHHHG